MRRVLLLDIGNTRLKWAVLAGDRLQPQRAVEHRGDWRVVQSGSLARAVQSADAVCCVSVAVPDLTRRLLAGLRRQGKPVRRLRSRREQLGLVNGYRDPWRLGADRWAAMLGAWARARSPRPRKGRAQLVISAGTALTGDLIDASGAHRGGVIAPGSQLTQQVLLARTAGIARRARGSRSAMSRRVPAAFGRSTAEALRAGAWMSNAALVERLRLEARGELGHYPRVVVTGGDAPELARYLKCPYEFVPDLVLRGLAAATLT